MPKTKHPKPPRLRYFRRARVRPKGVESTEYIKIASLPLHDLYVAYLGPSDNQWRIRIQYTAYPKGLLTLAPPWAQPTDTSPRHSIVCSDLGRTLGWIMAQLINTNYVMGGQ